MTEKIYASVSFRWMTKEIYDTLPADPAESKAVVDSLRVAFYRQRLPLLQRAALDAIRAHDPAAQIDVVDNGATQAIFFQCKPGPIAKLDANPALWVDYEDSADDVEYRETLALMRDPRLGKWDWRAQAGGPKLQ